MVTVVDYAKRQRTDGKEFIALILQSGLCLIPSQQTGNFYATVKKCSVPSTFDESTARAMIGQKVDGSIEKKPCESYEFTSKETGEIITLDYRWAFVPPGFTLENAIYEGSPIVQEVKPERKPTLLKF